MPMDIDEAAERHVRERIAEVASRSLTTFLQKSSYPLAMVYRSFGGFTTDNPTVGGRFWPVSWTDRLRKEDLLPPSTDTTGTELYLLGRAHRFMHVGDTYRARLYQDLAHPDGPYTAHMDATTRTAARMFLALLLAPSPIYESMDGDLANGLDLDDIDSLLGRVRQHPAFHWELTELFTETTRQHRFHYPELPQQLGNGALRFHATYQIVELAAALSDAPMGQVINVDPYEYSTLFNEGKVYLGLADLQMRRPQPPVQADLLPRTTQAITPLMLAWSPPHNVPFEKHVEVLNGYIKRNISMVAAIRPPNPATSGFMLIGPMHFKDVRQGDQPEFRFTLDKPMPTSLVSDWLTCGC